MSNFFEGGLGKLAASAVTKDVPAYVQFYVTARCNLACEQCNVIYANADQQECTTDEARRIAENLAAIGTSVVLLTGGEPFIRKDICDIAEAMVTNGVHPRIQTNGLATRAQLERMAMVGAHDVSISLDSVVPPLQDTINGDFAGSWGRAIRAISWINEIFPTDSFCSLGCVLAPRNLEHIEGVIRFATEIGWWVSLVPAHSGSVSQPRSFRSFNETVKFSSEDIARADRALARAAELRDAGYNLYDSDEYLRDIARFIRGEPILWRRRNENVCDSPNLYFAIQPNGDMAPCCDFRMSRSYPVFAPEFPALYRDQALREEVRGIVSQCDGCMYGSFPEITISLRFYAAMARRMRLFLLGSGQRKLRRLSQQQMIEAASDIASDLGLVN